MNIVLLLLILVASIDFTNLFYLNFYCSLADLIYFQLIVILDVHQVIL